MRQHYEHHKRFFCILDKTEGIKKEKRRLPRFVSQIIKIPIFLRSQDRSQDTVQELRPTQFVRESVILPGELPGVDNPLL
jgi:hypothetical protein